MTLKISIFEDFWQKFLFQGDNMKKFLLCLFSFLFISTATLGSGFLFAGCNQTHFEQAGGGFHKMKKKMQVN